MSGEEPGGFLARWSRRKAASREVVARKPAHIPDPPPPDLPPIESLGADSDYTVFLARGVSRAVQAQALRVAWASDPAIANFRGMAEYAWDFNAPGYGDLAPGDDAAEWLGQVVRSGSKLVAAVATEAQEGAPAQIDAPAPAPPCLTVDMAPAVSVVPPPPRRPAKVATPLSEAPETAEAARAVPKRRHGGALPV